VPDNGDFSRPGNGFVPGHCRISSRSFVVLLADETNSRDNEIQCMQARMKNPALIIPGALAALQALAKRAEKGGVPKRTLELVHLRVSQINGCSVCAEMSLPFLHKAGQVDEGLFLVSDWRDAPYFTHADRAALALSEAVTRLSDRADPVPDEIWNEAARHYDEKGLAALALWIAMTNLWNRLNTTTR
jgi:AhpD family alkylhydroperoxidase